MSEEIEGLIKEIEKYLQTEFGYMKTGDSLLREALSALKDSERRFRAAREVAINRYVLVTDRGIMRPEQKDIELAIDKEIEARMNQEKEAP